MGINGSSQNQSHNPPRPSGGVSSVSDQQSTPKTPAPDAPDVCRAERFVGNLNPEALIREELDATSVGQLRGRIGLWVSSPMPPDNVGDNGGSPRPSAALSDHLDGTTPPATQSVASVLQQRYASAVRACERLPRSTRDHLLRVYFSRVNHLLPLVDEDTFLRAYSGEMASVFLERAICLVAAKDAAATSSLRLVTDGPLLTPRQFCSDVYNGLVAAIDAGLEPDRITRIRILALMSLHSEGYEGAEAASMHICHAIHQAQTAGLHLHSQPGTVLGESKFNLFWCLWTLDKLHACIGGRPVLLADRDIGLEKPHVTNSHSRSAFEVWFAISDLLASIISLYRPNADDTIGWLGDFPAFEEMMGDDIRADLDFATLGFLELYYNAAVILSCRYHLSDHPDSSNPSYIRQGLAAIRIQSIVATECCQNLSPLPVVPYALALSMAVAYQQFRSSRLITHSDRAKASLDVCCSLLETLGICWYSAEAMARLGRKALHQIGWMKLQPQNRHQCLESRHSLPDTSPTHPGDPEEPAMALPSPPYKNSYHHIEEGPSLSTTVQAVSPREPSDWQGDPQENPEPNGFADIDMFFGDFLDLSLPTNFWDPVFLS
ncbi:hypothetical protein P168DRAFT_238759 [Aspergillus campestris IBT 28561]|uniref:Xylanolytic transcriptional activator regulatory domain-containing protein n=1 Tax=Aspergillus campestris (strain IBT 28561) TaxID=1392248 RepID=A0A2I1CZ55_ASPC2|nr:uncharacterized protein P168DRAFT_238759 [Aspergillus campestris IBT 28561]PKY02912.1 hypothetical protein P168DRAFT_238759 [Aspergillus campestris IBT 28561]